MSDRVEYLRDGDSVYPDAETFRYTPGHLDLELVFVVRSDRVVTVLPSPN
jgi:hypothetical protein